MDYNEEKLVGKALKKDGEGSDDDIKDVILKPTVKMICLACL